MPSPATRAAALLILLVVPASLVAAAPPPSSKRDAHTLRVDTPPDAPAFDCADAPDSRLTVCHATGIVLLNQRARFELDVPSERTVGCELVPIGRGDADLEVAPPAGSSTRAKASREAFGSDVVTFTAAEVADAADGPWTVEVLGFADVSEFSLRCELGAPAPATAAGDVAALRKVAADCCGAAAACPALAAALKDAAAGGAGPCGVPPNECDADGRLTALSLSGDGLACDFPAAVADLSELRTLDLTLNDLHGAWRDHVAPALAKLPHLTALHLSLNRLRGELSCAAFESAPGLSTVAVTGNAFTGALPACFVAAPMVELYASRNAFEGGVPSLKSASELAVLALSDQAGAGLTGPFPDLALAPRLRDVRLDRNALDGRLPTSLPPRLAALDASHNAVSGKLPSWPDAADLEVLILDDNPDLSGPLPPSIAALPSLRVLSAASAGLTGPLPSEWGPSLARVRLANNSLTGPLPGALGGLDTLAMLDVADNRLDGGLAAFAAAVDARTERAGGRDPTLRYLNLGANRFDGPVPAGLASVGALAPGAWGAAPDGVLIRKTLNISHNALDGPLPPWLVAALASSKDVAVGMEGNSFACPARGGRLRVSRALPASVATAVECVDAGGDRVPLADVLEVEDGGGVVAGRDRDDDDDEEKERQGKEEEEDRNNDVAADDENGRTAFVDAPPASDVDRPTPHPRSRAEPGSGLARPASADHEPGSRARTDDTDAAVERAAAAAAAASKAGGGAVVTSHDHDDDVDPAPPPRRRGHSAAAAAAVGVAVAAAAAAALRAGRPAVAAALARARGYVDLRCRGGGGAGGHAAMELVDVDDAAFQPDAALVPKLKPGRGVALAARAGPSDGGGGDDTIGAYRPPGGDDDAV